MKTLKEIVASNKTAYWSLIYLATRERHRSEPMRISRFKKSLVAFKLPVDLKELYSFFYDLAALEHGKIKKSRNVPFIFNWTSNFTDVALKAFDDIENNEDYKLLKMMIEDKKKAAKGIKKKIVADPKQKAPEALLQARSVEITLPNGLKMTVDLKAGESIQNLIKNLS